jgi:tRNA modification GTPase
VLIFDAGLAWTSEDQALYDAWPDVLMVHNKCDLPPGSAVRPPGLSVSALIGEGIEALAHAIAQRLVPDPPPPGAAVPFTEDHFRQIEKW